MSKKSMNEEEIRENEQRRAYNSEWNLLESFKSDLRTQIAALQKRIEYYDECADQVYDFLVMLEGKRESPEE